MSNKTKGYLLGAIAAATYGMNPLFALPLYQQGMNADSVVFFRYLLAIPILGIMLKMRGRSLKIQKKEVLPIAIMGLLIAISSICLFQSYNYMDAGIASTMLFVYPVMVAIIMAIGFKEKITLLTTFCILVALGGILLLYKGENGSMLSLTGTMLVMVSALSYAFYIVGVNQPVLKKIPTLKLTFYALIFGMSVFIIRTDFGTSLQVVDKWYLWGNLIALAVFPTVISFLCTTSAVQYIGSTPTAILGALEPVTAVFFGVVVFDEALTSRLILGILLIIISVTVIIAESNMKSYFVRFRKMFPKLPLKKLRNLRTRQLKSDKNKSVPIQTDPENLYTTTITKDFVKVEHPKCKTELIYWANINEISILNTDEGSFAPDVFLVLSGESEGCVLPQGSKGFEEVYDIISKYDGFNFENFINSMSCTENKRFILWKRER